MCMIIHLQALGMLPTCYSYISLAMAACTRMGLHRSETLAKFNTVEQETRKRIFWALRTMEAYITTILGLPRILSDEDTDQEFPGEVEDYLIIDGNSPSSADSLVSSMAIANAHTKLLIIMGKLKQFVLGSGKADSKDGGTYRVDYARIIEAEKELESWVSQLPKNFGMQETVATNLDV
jgi:hypothetical protein